MRIFQVPSVTFSSGITAEGVSTVALYIANICNINLLGDAPQSKAEIHQWLEYRQNYFNQASKLDKSQLKPVLQVYKCNSC